MRYRVIVSAAASADLDPFFDFVLGREPGRDDGDLTLSEQAVGTIQGALTMLERHPYTCRKSADNPFWRELVISFGRTGYVALFEIADHELVIVTAIRHQREDDYH